MAKMLASLINRGILNSLTGEPWKFEDIPERWREEVELLLTEEK